MSNDMCKRRLSRELTSLSKSPLPYIDVCPNPDNFLE
ncbi:hypothetical protein TrRE_jg8868, partial [Triparma retinervis]